MAAGNTTGPEGGFGLLQGSIVVVTGVAVLLTWTAFKARTPIVIAPVSVAEMDSLTPYLSPTGHATRLAPPPIAAVLSLRDPFVMVAVARAPAERPAPSSIIREPSLHAESTWVVDGVFVSGDNRSAIINETLVKLGGSVGDGVRLTAVESDHVVLTDEHGHRMTIAVGKDGER